MRASAFRRNGLIFAILMIVLTCSRPSSAAIRTVTDFGDTVSGGAPGQLRLEINAAAPGDTIVIPAGTITLTGASGEDANASGDLDLTKGLTIQGAGAGATVVDGGDIDRVFHILSGASVAISGLTIRGGLAPIEFLTRGGGVFIEAGTLNITDCIISDNTSPGTGGGLYNNGGSNLTVANSTISDNTGYAGGGIYNIGILSISGSTVSDNVALGHGGGLANLGGTATATNCTFSGNSAATDGGGLSGNGLTTLNNVTITDNIADDDNNGTGDGGGIAAAGGFILKNTLLAGNTDRGGEAPDCSLTSISSDGHNLLGDVSGCGFAASTGDLIGASGSPIDPLLGPLADNGGPTDTHLLLPGSPAIDAGDACPDTDQRGESRPADGDDNGSAICDIGAVERNPTPPVGPDLIGTWRSLRQRCKGTGATQKCKLKGSVRVSNQGVQKATVASVVQFYLSTDSVFNAGDTFLRQVAVGTLKVGKAKSKKLSHKLPVGQTASGQYVIAVLDATELIAEQDETNNVVVFGTIP